MRPFNELLREAKQGNRPAVTVNVINPEDLVNPGARNPISKKGFGSFLDTAADAAKKGYNLYRKGKKLADFSNPGDKK